MRDDTQLMDQWLRSLPPAVREALATTQNLLENFSSNVQIAEALNQICFRRAVDATLDEDLTEIDVSMRMAMALKSNNQAAKLKQQRLEVLRDFDHVQDVPKPINVEYTLRITEMTDQVDRLRALGRHADADKLEQDMQRRGLMQVEPDE